MNWINDDKLTAFDRQVLNTVALESGRWSLHETGMWHPTFGSFIPSLNGFGLQADSQAKTPHFRLLSWRGQLRLRQQWRELLASAVDVTKAEGNYAPHGASAMMGPTVGVAYAPNRALTATEIQQSAMERMQKLQQLFDNKVDQAAAHSGDALRYQMGAMQQQPSQDLLFGVSVQKLAKAGMTPKDLAEFKNALHHGGPVPDEVFDRTMELVAKVQEGQ